MNRAFKYPCNEVKEYIGLALSKITTPVRVMEFPTVTYSFFVGTCYFSPKISVAGTAIFLRYAIYYQPR